MRAFVLMVILASASIPVTSASAAASAPANDTQASAAAPIEVAANELSARKKQRRHRHVYRGYRHSYGYDRPYNQGYYLGVRPGWGYGPDPGDRAWPPFHFKPYW